MPAYTYANDKQSVEVQMPMSADHPEYIMYDPETKDFIPLPENPVPSDGTPHPNILRRVFHPTRGYVH